MNEKTSNGDSYHSLLLLEEISKEEPVSQRELSKRLGIALGLVNSYVKNMISKGYIRVTSFPRNRYHYLLTPKGITEKSRLTYQHLHYFTNLYTTARKDYRDLFDNLERSGIERVIFCGVDEVAEIAYLSLQETDIELVGVVDGECDLKQFFGYEILQIEDISGIECDRVVLTSLKRQKRLVGRLEEMGMRKDKICIIKAS